MLNASSRSVTSICSRSGYCVHQRIIAPAGWSNSSGKPKEYRERAIQPHRILIVEFSDALAQPRLRHGGDFIGHESGSALQTVAIGGLDEHTQ
jgi:hypothetical protein